MISMRQKTIFLTCALATWLPAQTVNSAPAQLPLYLGGVVEPNIVFTLDDSGSMHWELMPEAIRNAAYFLFPREVSNIYGGSDYNNTTFSHAPRS